MTEPAAQWNDPAWLSQAHGWIRETLAAQAWPFDPQLPIQTIRARPWSTVLRASTPRGFLYFKASASTFAHEPALTQALYQARPDCIVQVLAVHPTHPWMLMADEGTPLREQAHSDAYLPAWQRLLPLFATLQIEMAPRTAELLTLGLPDRSLTRLPRLFAELLADPANVRLDASDGLSPAQYDRLRAFQPTFADLCRRLAQSPIPASLHHDDFHDANVFMRAERITFSDWGESSLTHPFFSLIVNLRSTADRLDLPEEATQSPEHFTPLLNELRDLYLQPWTVYAPLAVLRETFALAWRVGMVNRALTWHEVLQQSHPSARAEYGYAVPAWLQEFLLTV